MCDCNLPSYVTFTSETIRRKQFQSNTTSKYDHNLVSRWSHNDISTSPSLAVGEGEGGEVYWGDSYKHRSVMRAKTMLPEREERVVLYLLTHPAFTSSSFISASLACNLCMRIGGNGHQSKRE